MILGTAHDEFAVRAFDEQAVDYLLGPSVTIPSGASVIDLSSMTVMPGLVAHNHLALTYKPVPERRDSRSCATWATTATTRIRRWVRRLNRADPGADDHQLRLTKS